MKNSIKAYLSNFLFKSFYKLPIEKDILTIDQRSGVVVREGRVISGQELINLRQEAEYFKNTELYKIMISTPSHHAKEIMYNKSTSFNDMLGGKFVLYTISLQENIINKLTK